MTSPRHTEGATATHRISACYFPKAGEADLFWQRIEDGKSTAMTVKVTAEQGKALADVVWPCIEWDAIAAPAIPPEPAAEVKADAGGITGGSGASADRFGLGAEQIDALRTKSLKPEEIAGAPDVQLDRVRELVRWFARLADGHANPKWIRGHAFELAYYVANMDVKRDIDLKTVREASFKQGAAISPAERRMLERIGFLGTPPAPNQGAGL